MRLRKGQHSRGVHARASLTLLDQIFSSTSNFAVGVVVARVAGPSGLGGFAFAYASWQLLAAMHRSLVTDPMAIEGDVHKEEVVTSMKRGLAAEMLLGSVGALIMGLFGAILWVLGQRTFGIAVVAMAPWVPLLQAQDYWRWMGFLSRRPSRSLANDAMFNCAQAAAIAVVLAAHLHSAAAVITSWGLGGAVGALYGLRQYRVVPSFRGGLHLLRSRWSFSKWIAGNQLLTAGATQMYVAISAAILGPIALGGFKAAQALVIGPAGVLIQAGGSLGLPESSRAYSSKGWWGLLRVSRLVTAAGTVSIAACVIVVGFWGSSLLRLFYGPEFAKFQSVAMLIGIGFILIGLALGPILVLKVTRRTKWLFHTQVLDLVVSLCAIAILSSMYGVKGTAIATIISGALELATLRWFQRKTQRSLEAEEPPVVAGAPPLVPLPVAPINRALGSTALSSDG